MPKPLDAESKVEMDFYVDELKSAARRSWTAAHARRADGKDVVRAQCTCGHIGPWRRRYESAIHDQQRHKAKVHLAESK